MYIVGVTCKDMAAFWGGVLGKVREIRARAGDIGGLTRWGLDFEGSGEGKRRCRKSGRREWEEL